MLTAEITDEMLQAVTDDPEQLRIINDLGLRSALVVPLRARGRTLGTITWVNGPGSRRYNQSDVDFASGLADRAAVAIDNAELHSELQETADRLRRTVVPARLPHAPGWRLGAYYSSAGRTEVGGDFYDAIVLGDGRVALVIGDVMGRGVEAAAAMSQVRAATRAFIAVDPGPASVFERLDRLFETYPTDQLVTMAYAVADTEADELQIVVAGHPPPLVVDETGGATFIESAVGRLFGVGASERRSVTVPFRRGQTVLLYTDGLIERRQESMERSQRRLAEAASTYAFDDIDANLHAIADALCEPAIADDVAILAARHD